MKAACVVFTILSLSPSFLFSNDTYYEVQENDTLYGISRQFKISVDDIMRLNDITDARFLKAGDRLIIPSVYGVQKGDTLYGIARRLDTTVEILLDLNAFEEDYVLKSGEGIFVPLAVRGEMMGASDMQAMDEIETPGDPPTTFDTTLEGRIPFWPHQGNRIDKIGKLTGLEIVGEKGDDVFTVASGEVVWSAPYRGYGKIVIIESIDKYLYLYGGNETVIVSIGQRVTAGAKIARLGIDPHSGEARLFFGVYKGGEYIDPGSAPRG